MPLTFAHPAASLPLARLGLPLSALAVGAMAPDFPYFLALRPGPGYGHTLPGLFLFDLPVGLMVLWIFHRLVKRPLVELCPPALRTRLRPWTDRFDFASWPRRAMVALGVLLGSVTHLVWDAFTHHDGWAVLRLPTLSRSVSLGPLGDVGVYKLLQHGSTLLGLAVLALWAAWALRHRNHGSDRAHPGERRSVGHPARPRGSDVVRRGVRIALLVVPPLLGALWAFATADLDEPRVLLGRWVVATTTAAFLLATSYGVWALRAPRRFDRS